MSDPLDEILDRIRAEAMARGVDWLRQKVAEALKDEATAPSTQDPPPPPTPPPCASRVRPREGRSPSPVPRTQPRLRSPSRDTPEPPAWQHPPSKVLGPERNPFHHNTGSRDRTHAVHRGDTDWRPPLDTTSQRGGPSCADDVIVSMEDDGLSDDDDSGQHRYSPSKDSGPDLASASTAAAVTTEESDAARIERVLQSCSAAAKLVQRPEAVPSSLSAADCQPCLVWILGDSFVTSALKRLSLLPDGCQLGFPRSRAIIRWLGTDGLTWNCVRPIATRHSLLEQPPDILVVNAGADDLGVIPIKYLIEHIKFDMLRLKALFSGAVVVWSDIVNRPKWPKAHNKEKLVRARTKVNHTATKFLSENGVVVIRHKVLEDGSPHLFEEDGLFLNAAGSDIWCIDIQEGIDEALQLWQSSHGTTPNPTV